MSLLGRLQAIDAAHVYAENSVNFPNVVDVWVFDTSTVSAVPEDAVAAASWLRTRIHCDPVFHQRLLRVPRDLDYPLWVDDPDFSIENHVTASAANGSGWAAVGRAIANTLEKPVDLSRPPWRLHLVVGVSGVPGFPDRATVAILTFHHAAGDGVRTVELGEMLFGAQPSVLAAAPDNAVRPRGVLAAAACVKLPASLGRFAFGLAKGLRAHRAVVRATRRGELLEPNRQWPVTRFNRAYSGRAAVRVVSVSMEEARTIRAGVAGATVNDVAMTVVSVALSAYQDEHGERPSGSLGAIVPMSWRRSGRNLSRANQFDLMSVDLHTGTSDPLERLVAVSVAAQREKRRQHHAAVIRRGMVAESAPAILLRLAGRGGGRPPTGPTVPLGNVTISNVPRGNPDLRFGDAPVAAGFGVLAIGTGELLNHFVSSLHGRLTITVTADEAVMPDIDRYAELLEHGFDELATAARAAG